MWFATAEGLSRYDGQRFRNYGTEQGLPNAVVHHIAEDPKGRLWIIAGSTLARMVESADETAPSLLHAARVGEFVRFRVGAVDGSTGRSGGASVLRVAFAADGTIWCVTTAGLYRSADPDRQPFELVLQIEFDEHVWASAIRAPNGDVWFGYPRWLVRVRGGRAVRIGLPPQTILGGARALALAGDDLLVARGNGVFRFDTNGERWKRLPLEVPTGAWVGSVVAQNGVVLAGTDHGAFELDETSGSPHTTRVLDSRVASLAADRQGNTWVMSDRGVAKIPRARVRTYTAAHGLSDPRVVRIVEDRAGRMYASTFTAGVFEIRDGAATLVPGSNTPAYAAIGRRILCDARGDWWVMTGDGLFRLPGPALRFRASSPVVPVSAAAFVGTVGPGLFEHPDGSIWVNPPAGQVFRVGRTSNGTPADAVRVPDAGAGFSRFMVDRTGAVWMSGLDHLERVAAGARTQMQPRAGLPERSVRSMYSDSAGRFWLGLRYGGVSVIDNPSASPLAFRNYSTRDGLSSNAVWAIEEDRYGRMYFGTGRGLDRLDVATGAIRHFSTADGLAAANVNHLLRDRHGDIWIATSGGLSRLSPEPPASTTTSPPIYITAVRVAGEALAVPARGASSLGPMTLGASQNNLRVEFVGPDFEGDAGPSYQYRLDGADTEWSPPAPASSVTYARLEPGRYRFQVRTVTAGGQTTARPAVLHFEIVPPIWRRWWFLLLAFGAIAAAGWTGHRTRMRRLIAIDAVRRRVAQDLHDDMGSGLAQIAILTEVARRDAAPAGAAVLAETAGLARTLREVMSDIVWMVDPHKDRLVDLVGRMRQVTFNLLESDGLHVEFRAPDAAALSRIALAPERRRQLLLAFKEIVTNVARHARATRVSITLAIAGGRLELRVEDDGCGFDVAAVSEGHGLRSLQQRASALEGSLAVVSTPGGATVVTLVVPV